MIFLILVFFRLWVWLGDIKSEVVGIQDGDTIELKMVYSGENARNRKGKNLRIRLAHVNCPEKGKAFYTNAKQFSSNLCFRKIVTIIHSNKFDRYGRLIGEVILPNGKNLNKELVNAGLAIHFKKYSNSSRYANLELQARIKKVGIWH